jgi:hypothetical protein
MEPRFSFLNLALDAMILVAQIGVFTIEPVEVGADALRRGPGRHRRSKFHASFNIPTHFYDTGADLGLVLSQMLQVYFEPHGLLFALCHASKEFRTWGLTRQYKYATYVAWIPKCLQRGLPRRSALIASRYSDGFVPAKSRHPSPSSEMAEESGFGRQQILKG